MAYVVKLIFCCACGHRILSVRHDGAIIGKGGRNCSLVVISTMSVGLGIKVNFVVIQRHTQRPSGSDFCASWTSGIRAGQSKRPSFAKIVGVFGLARIKIRLGRRNWRILAQEAYYPMYHKLNLIKASFAATLVIEASS